MSNARLEKTLDWYCGLLYNGKFYTNHYTARIKMLTLSCSNDEQNIAYERMKIWIQDILSDAIFIAQSNPQVSVWQKTDAKIILFPNEPVDQVVGALLFLKLNAIMEGRMRVTDVEISSGLGDNVGYHFHCAEEFVTPIDTTGWWTEPRPIWSSPTQKKASGKVVELALMPDWDDYDLNWESAKSNDPSSVVFANFNKNEPK